MIGASRLLNGGSVLVSIIYQANRIPFGEILSSKSISEEISDTVSVDDISTVEDPNINITHAELPTEPFIDKFVEPFVIIGATGVAVYLFFHVRSQ